jgi:hypothetical protein
VAGSLSQTFVRYLIFQLKFFRGRRRIWPFSQIFCVQAIRDGLVLLTWQSDTFAYAESFDDAAGRYRGLRCGHSVMLNAEDAGLIVKPEVARRQLDAEARSDPGRKRDCGYFADHGRYRELGTGCPAPCAAFPRNRFSRCGAGRARCRPDRGRGDRAPRRPTGCGGLGDAGIDARLPNGASEQTVRAVTENSRTLKFSSHGFENE